MQDSSNHSMERGPHLKLSRSNPQEQTRKKSKIHSKLLALKQSPPDLERKKSFTIRDAKRQEKADAFAGGACEQLFRPAPIRPRPQPQLPGRPSFRQCLHNTNQKKVLGRAWWDPCVAWGRGRGAGGGFPAPSTQQPRLPASPARV